MDQISEREEALHALFVQDNPEILAELGKYLEAIVNAIERIDIQEEELDFFIQQEIKIQKTSELLFEQAKERNLQIETFQELIEAVHVLLKGREESDDK